MTGADPASVEHDTLGIDAVCSALLDPATPLGELKHAFDGFLARCLRHLPALGEKPTQLACGQALAPIDAARCVQDFLRTAHFVRAVDSAIRTRLERAPDASVNVLYAGSGPIAPLALLLARRYRRHGVRFTLVDVHSTSLAAASDLFSRADAMVTLRETVCADAAQLRLCGDLSFDILVVEIMQRALAREPQLAVLANLLPQCAHDVVLVPGRVLVSACLARVAAEHGSAVRERVDLGTLIDLSIETLPAVTAALQTGVDALPEVVLQVPAASPVGLDLMLRTRIETLPGGVLDDYDSGLTYPLLLPLLDAPVGGDRLGFTYRMGREPGFTVRQVRSDERNREG